LQARLGAYREKLHSKGKLLALPVIKVEMTSIEKHTSLLLKYNNKMFYDTKPG